MLGNEITFWYTFYTRARMPFMNFQYWYCNCFLSFSPCIRFSFILNCVLELIVSFTVDFMINLCIYMRIKSRSLHWTKEEIIHFRLYWYYYEIPGELYLIEKKKQSFEWKKNISNRKNRLNGIYLINFPLIFSVYFKSPSLLIVKQLMW